MDLHAVLVHQVSYLFRAMGGQNGTSDVCILTPETLNPKILKAQYAVRGEIVARAQEIVKELAEGKKFPFDKVVFCNIGNPQQLGQVPISFVRQVLALCDYPQVHAWPDLGLYQCSCLSLLENHARQAIVTIQFEFVH